MEKMITQQELAELTDKEISLLYRLNQSPERTGFTVDEMEGGIASQLSRKGIINKFGKVGRRYRWRVPEMGLELRKLLFQLAGQ